MAIAAIISATWSMAGCSCNTYKTQAEVDVLLIDQLTAEWRRLGGWCEYADGWPSAEEYRRVIREERLERAVSWTEVEKQKIRDRKVWEDARDVHVIWSWGYPISKDVIKTPGRTSETWYYGNSQTLYFSNGHLDFWIIEN